ncbi:MAG: heavy metal translocating P-type ATPase [Anaerostipes sp.]
MKEHNHEHEHDHQHDHLDIHHHEHGEACGCGCDHEHHHHHHHHHHNETPCCVGCGNHLEDCICEIPENQIKKEIFILEDLGCANCAAKMESKIKDLPAIKSASITFATKQLRVACKDPQALLPVFQRICEEIESDVRVVPRTKKAGKGEVTKVYIMKNVDCANCAAKMETKINELPEVSHATITFATKQLRVTGKNPDALISQMEELCCQVDDGIEIIPRETTKKEVKKESFFAKHKDMIQIVIGAVLFVGVEVYSKVVGLEEFTLPLIGLLVIAYLVLGGEVVFTAIKNITKGQIFDENFLMSVATIGAFCIKEYPEAVGVMLFFKVGEWFEHIAVEKSRSQIMDAVDLRPEVVNLVDGDDIKIIDAQEAKVGDILLVRPGDRIPLDGTVIDGESRIDTSAVTGEPVPVKVESGSEVISGCVNTSGLLKIRTEKILEESMVSRILDSVENAAASKPKLDAFITRFARVYTPIVVAVALFTAVGIPLVTGQEFGPWIYTALTFLVMSCPCALVLSVPLAFFCGIGAGSKKGILFKGGIVLEALANVKAVVMDKTGTITEGNFVVQNVVTSDGKAVDEILKLAARCELTSTHPIGTSIVEAASEKGFDIIQPEKVEEISGKGIKALIDGKEVLCGNVKLMNTFGIDISTYKNAGAGSEVLVAVDGIYAGNIVISDTMKEEAPYAIERISKQGIVTAMLTGDSDESARAMAKKAGVAEVHAKLMPQEKLSEVQHMRDSYGQVMFVGDGINDAPVLAGADVGAAMGSGADAAIEAADVVFMNSNMDAIPGALDIAKATVGIARQNVIGALAIKIAVMILGLSGIYANMWLAVFADTGVAFLCILNSIRILYRK